MKGNRGMTNDEGYILTMHGLTDVELVALFDVATMMVNNYPGRFDVLLRPLQAAVQGETARRSGKLPSFRGFIIPALGGFDLDSALLFVRKHREGIEAGGAAGSNLAVFYTLLESGLLAASAGAVH